MTSTLIDLTLADARDGLRAKRFSAAELARAVRLFQLAEDGGRPALAARPHGLISSGSWRSAGMSAVFDDIKLWVTY